MNNYIYAIKNLVNNKLYIGSTKSLKRRKYEHFYELKRNIHFSQHLQRAYNKYGKDNFSFYMLEECAPENRKIREIYFTQLYKTYDPLFGYNTYEPNEDKFQCSEATKAKLRESHKKRSISVDLYTIEGIFIQTFSSGVVCSKFIGCHNTIIFALLKGTRLSYKGFVVVAQGNPFAYTKSPKTRDMSRFYSK